MIGTSHEKIIAFDAPCSSKLQSERHNATRKKDAMSQNMCQESIIKTRKSMYRICRSGEGTQSSFENFFVGELALAGSA